jgi:ABC-type uncharacterized transport system permease subunit
MIAINKNPSRKELAIFALLAGIFLFLLSFLARSQEWTELATLLKYAAPLSALVGLSLAYIWPASLRIIYLGWMYAALPIGWVVSHLLLALIYYLMVTPIGLFMRLVGSNPLQRRLDPDADSYWLERKPKEEAKRYFKQF